MSGFSDRLSGVFRFGGSPLRITRGKVPPVPIDIIATRTHYLEHLLPVWWALPEERRGGVYAPASRGVIPMCEALGIPAESAYAPRSREPVLLSGGGDLTYAGSRPVIQLEHGAGQTYLGLDDPSHAGGRGRDGVALFCHPREQTAALDRARYPEAQVEVVGCPRLDRWHAKRKAESVSLREPGIPDSGIRNSPTVGVTFHWPADTVNVPEARWAFPHYGRAALEVLALRYPVVGHGHPRGAGWLRSEYVAARIPWEPNLDRFFSRIDVLVADNTSALPEFASALDKPVVFLNAPWYRRDVEHGCRFWDWPRGQVEVDDPGGLVDGVTEALLDGRGRAEARRAMTRATYAFDDGLAAERTAGHITTRWP